MIIIMRTAINNPSLWLEHDIGVCRLLIKGQTTQNKGIWAIISALMGHVNEYPTMHYFGNLGHTRSMTAYIYRTLTEYFWKFQWKVALWESCSRALLIVWCRFSRCALSMLIAEFGLLDNVLRMLHKSRQRNINLIQFDCCQCLLSRCHVTLKLH